MAATATTPAASSGAKPRRPRIESYHEALLTGIVEGKSLSEAARVAKVPLRTAQRWASRHEKELKRARAQILDRVIGSFTADQLQARTVLLQLATDEAAAAAPGAAVRKGAAVALTDCLVKLKNAGELEDRLHSLEDALSRLSGAPATPGPAAPVLDEDDDPEDGDAELEGEGPVAEQPAPTREVVPAAVGPLPSPTPQAPLALEVAPRSPAEIPPPPPPLSASLVRTEEGVLESLRAPMAIDPRIERLAAIERTLHAR